MDKELRILMLEESPVDAELEEHQLRKAGLVFTSKVVDTKEAFLKALDEFSPDLILSDYDLPTFDGLEALRIAKEKCPDMPVILVTGRLGEEFAIEKLKEGATDYVLKSNLKRLVPAINRALEEADERAERRRTEEKLHDSERRLALASSIAHVGHWDLNEQTGDLIWTDEVYRIFGYEPGEIVPSLEMFMSHVHPEDRERLQKAIKASTSKPISYNVEFRYRRKDGKECFGLAIGGAEFDQDSRAMRMSGAMQDITEIRRAEVELIESEARYRSYIEVTGQIAWVTNAAGEVVEDVPSLRRFSGQTYEEARGSGWAKALHPDDIDRTLQVWNNAVAARSPYEIEYRMRRHDGVYRHLLARGFPVFREDGSIREWVGTCIDITERKRAEETLQESEEKFRKLFESSRDALMTLEPPSWAFTSGNPATIAMFRAKDEEDFTSHAPWQLSPERQIDGRASEEKAREMIETAMREGSHFFEWTHKRIDGEAFPATVLLTRMELAGRRFLQATVRDITNLKRLEEELRSLSLHDELTGLYNRRGFFTLAEQQLKLADRMKNHVSLLFTDIDGLKQINDTLGHQEGDRAIIDLANVIKGTFRQSDIIARFGGDEFVVLALCSPEEYCKRLMSRLKDSIVKFNLKTDRPYKLVISIGVAHYHPEKPVPIDELISLADKLMYEEKQREKAGN